MTVTGSPQLVELDSDGAPLRGQLYTHHPGRARPVVVMAHGFSATITGMVADRYAEVLHAAGFDVLLFDHRGFGLSGGEPRRPAGRRDLRRPPGKAAELLGFSAIVMITTPSSGVREPAAGRPRSLP